jgi:ABC-type transporter Mla subunit MlaD
MSGAEAAILRPRMEALKEQGENLSQEVKSMGRQLDEAIANADRASNQLRGYAVEIGELNHQLNSLRASIGILIDELDGMDPPANNNAGPAPKKGGGK